MAAPHVALLRGINVGGHRPLPMADLRAVMADLGHPDARTYVQSGNVVFTATPAGAATLPERLAAAIADRWGYEVPVIGRSAAELAQVAAACPYAPVDPARDGTRVLVTFLSGRPTPEAVDALAARARPAERVVAVGTELHLHCPDGYADSRLTNDAVEKATGRRATTRNWKTVLKLLDMTGVAPGKDA